MKTTLPMIALMAATLAAAPAQAFKILFYDMRPSEKLLDLPTLTGSRTVSADEFAELGAEDLLAYDMLYVDSAAGNIETLAKRDAVIAKAVSSGMGLYLQGAMAGYAAAPVTMPGLRSMMVEKFRVADNKHPLATNAELIDQDFGDAYSAKAMGFMFLPEGFTTIAEAVSLHGEAYPIVVAGRFGRGRVVLRTHSFTDSDAYGVQKVDAAIIAWLAGIDGLDHNGPIQWLVSKYHQPVQPLVATPVAAEGVLADAGIPIVAPHAVLAQPMSRVQILTSAQVSAEAAPQRSISAR